MTDGLAFFVSEIDINQFVTCHRSKQLILFLAFFLIFRCQAYHPRRPLLGIHDFSQLQTGFSLENAAEMTDL